jgi:hypothetical protein
MIKPASEAAVTQESITRDLWTKASVATLAAAAVVLLLSPSAASAVGRSPAAAAAPVVIRC